MTWIQTYTGIKFDLLDPQPEMINILDIAHSLSNICRFTGHCKHFYSVAQHSVFVSRLVPPDLAIQGLLHDATEAYVSDMAGPLKAELSEYRKIEDKIWTVIARAFNLPEKLDPAVKRADGIMLVTERRDLMAPTSVLWAPEIEILTPFMPDDIVYPSIPSVARDMFLTEASMLGVRYAND